MPIEQVTGAERHAAPAGVEHVLEALLPRRPHARRRWRAAGPRTRQARCARSRRRRARSGAALRRSVREQLGAHGGAVALVDALPRPSRSTPRPPATRWYARGAAPRGRAAGANSSAPRKVGERIHRPTSAVWLRTLRCCRPWRTRGCGGRSGAGTSAIRCPGTARASTASSRAAARSRAGRCTGTCSRRSARGGWRWASTRCSSRTSGSPRRTPLASGSAPGRFLNIGVMVASVELVEIGDHCMFANGCFVTDAHHRFDDPDRPVPWQGFTSKGPDAGGRQRLVRRQRRRHQRRDDRRALRDRRQQRRDARTSRLLDGGGEPRAGAAADRVPGSGQQMTIRWNGRSSSFPLRPVLACARPRRSRSSQAS